MRTQQLAPRAGLVLAVSFWLACAYLSMFLACIRAAIATAMPRTLNIRLDLPPGDALDLMREKAITRSRDALRGEFGEVGGRSCSGEGALRYSAGS
jgi:hypothetical protein